MQHEIVEKLISIHKKYRLNEGDVSTHTRSAQKITREWQQQVVNNETIRGEVSVSDVNNEKFDLVDFSNLTAYELKVSGKNPHHEFYKDLLKVLTYNCNHSDKIIRLVFISEEDGIKKLEKRIDPRLQKLFADVHNITFELVSLKNQKSKDC